MGTVRACPRCGWLTDPGMSVCPSCGQALVAGEAPRAPTPPVPYPSAEAPGPYAVPQQPYAPAYGYAPPARSRTGLLVAALAVGGLVVLVVGGALIALLANSGRGSSVVGGTTSGSTQVPGNQGSSGGTRGRVGERVESAGLAITVLEVLDEPDPSVESVVFELPEGMQYIACDVVLENNTGFSLFYAGSSFKLKDSNSYEYDQTPFAHRFPELDFGTMTNREKVRGFVNFLVPGDATGLSLIYQYVPVAGYETIYIEVGR